MKLKINLNRPDISSEEINKRKKFEDVAENYLKANKSLFRNKWFLSSAVVAIVGIVTSLLLLNRNPEAGTKVPELMASHQKHFINPPLKNVNVPYLIYKLIAQQGATLYTKTGSQIDIPKNSFVDELGHLLSGEIELHYREFHDATDFFVSGIPMTYDSAGVKYQFESAGMIEMLAFQNGKPVKVSPVKSINIELASTYKGTEYNLYKLDTTLNNWSCLGKDKVVESKNKSTNTKDSTTFSMSKQLELKKIETKITSITQEKEKTIAALQNPLPEPKKPQQSTKNKYTFNIDVNAKEFPELALYKGVLFEVGDENKNFNSSLYSITWEDASLKEGTKKDINYLLTLKKGLKKYEFVVYPVFEGKNFEDATNIFTNKYKEYTTVLTNRIAEEKKIEEEYQAKLFALKKQREELERKWKEEQRSQFNLMSTEEKVKRVFAINSFGIYNSDACKQYPQGVLCTANLVNDKNIKLMCYDIFLVDKAKNSLFTYNKNPIAQFSFNPHSVNLLWTVEDGVLYWLKPEQFNAISKADGAKVLKMNRVEQKFLSVEDVRTYFNL